MNKSILLTNIMIIIVSVFTPVNSARSQEFLPASKEVDYVQKATIYGIGTISTGNDKETKSVDPSSRVVLDYNLSPRWRFFSIFNIGSGLESTEESTGASQLDTTVKTVFDINSIFFPEASDIGGKVGYSIALWRKVDMKGSGADPTHLSENDHMQEVAFFGEWSFQKREATLDQEDLKFFATTFKLGINFSSVERFEVGGDNFQTFKFSGGVYYTRINITDGTEVDFRKIFGDQIFPVAYDGVGVKIGFQYNTFIYEMDIQQVWSGKGIDMEDQIIQEKFSAKISAAGVGLVLGRMKRNSLNFFNKGN